MPPPRNQSKIPHALSAIGVLLLLVSTTTTIEAAQSHSQSNLPSPTEFLQVLTLENHNTRIVVLSTTLLGITSGLVGTFLLLRRRSLIGDALSHATLPGIGIAFIVMVAAGGSGKSLPGLLAGATVTGLAGVLLVLTIRNTTKLKDDVAMGFVLSVFFGIGVALLGIIQKMPGASAAGLQSFIYGKTASMIQQDFVLIASITAATTLFSLLLVKEFTLLCFDEGFAAAEGWPTLFLDILMLGIVTAVTVIGLQAVGLILIIAFLITPATAARFWTQNLKYMLAISALIGGASGWLGASISALLPKLPAGAIIVLVAATIFLISMIFAPARGVLPRYFRQANLRRKVGRQHLLRAIYEILESKPHPLNKPVPNLPVLLANLQSHRSWSPKELRKLLRTAQKEDHLDPAPDGEIRLSESGYGEAARTTRNHRLWELYLIRHADIAPSHVDRDADMVEHVLDAHIVRQLEAELDNHHVTTPVPPSPHQITPSQSSPTT
ncbi:MAG: iron chelate uptake ABC transporter family permease subunit [Verrucomicrobiota bacterium]